MKYDKDYKNSLLAILDRDDFRRNFRTTTASKNTSRPFILTRRVWRAIVDYVKDKAPGILNDQMQNDPGMTVHDPRIHATKARTSMSEVAACRSRERFIWGIGTSRPVAESFSPFRPLYHESLAWRRRYRHRMAENSRCDYVSETRWFLIDWRTIE